MKLYEIITSRTPLKLQHPTVGDVNWDMLPSSGCFCLFWEYGPEAGQALIVDESVMLDDDWVIRND